MSAGVEAARFGSGRAVNRVEDPALVAGRGRYADDVAVAGQAHVVFVRSSYAHARIVSIDTAAARETPGVLAVFTGDDLASAGVKPFAAPPFKRADGGNAAAHRPALAQGMVRFVGEPVVAIVAETPDAARAAAGAVWIDCEELPAVVDAARATAPGGGGGAPPTTWRPRCVTATRAPRRRRSRAPRTRCRSRS
jgi:carbon-monoxide dehydrogenase large subunit